MAPNTFALTEPGVTAILARLEDPAQLNVEIASIAAGIAAADQKASLVPIPPAQIFDFVPPPSFLTDFPTLGISDMSSKGEDDTGSTMTGRHVFGVTIFCSDPNPQILAWQLRRYAQAVTRVLLANRSFPETNPPLQAGWGSGFDSIGWGPTLSSKATPQTWMSWCVVAIWTRREEI